MTTASTPRWPEGASDEYTKARNDLVKDEWALRDQIEKVAAKRRALPLGPIMKEYKFCDVSGQVTLADLVPDKRSLVVYSMMLDDGEEHPCGMCANIVDGFNGVAKHIEQNVDFVVVAKAPIKQVLAYAEKRGWKQLRFLSSSENSFNADMHMEKAGAQMPGVHVFTKDEQGNVRHRYSMSAAFDKNTIRGLDLLAPLWSVLDLVPEGRGDFNASNDYVFK